MTDSSSEGRDDAELAKVIAAGAIQLSLDLDRVQLDRLVAYIRQIERWNTAYNLTAIRDGKSMATQHIVDSLSMLPALLQLRRGRHRFQLLDVGSGAGLPGVVVAIAKPDIQVRCVDSVGKKAAFVTHVAAALELDNLSAVHGRVQAIQPPPSYEVITSRAFASLPDFVTSTRHLLQPGGRWLAMKGKIPSEEIVQASGLQTEFEARRITVPGLEADRCLLIGRDLLTSEC